MHGVTAWYLVCTANPGIGPLCCPDSSMFTLFIDIKSSFHAEEDGVKCYYYFFYSVEIYRI